MFKNFYKLNLTANPLKIDDYSNYQYNDYWSVESNVRKILNDELINVFDSIGVDPTIAVFFTANNSSRSETHEFAHTDCTLKDDKWQNVPFAINWELNTDIETTICWYDTSLCVKKEPLTEGKDIEYPFNYLNGAFYLGEKTIIEHVVLDRKKIYNPILFRTDVAHGVSSYKTSESKRMCLSLRFEKIKSWVEAVEIFQSYIVSDI